MKGLGILLLIIGLPVLFLGLAMDTTVAAGMDGDRVHNIGLMNQQQNAILIGIALFIVGVILIVMGRRSSRTLEIDPDTSATANQRACPFCAESIRKEAIICRFCNRDVPASPASQPAALSHDELMAKFGISNDGLKYRLEGHDYDRLEDAVAYAERRTRIAEQSHAASRDT